MNIRVLLPSTKFNTFDISSITSSRILVKYFDRQLSSNMIILNLDSELMYTIEKSGNSNDGNRYFIQYIKNESERLVYSTLFERMWLLEKSVTF